MFFAAARDISERKQAETELRLIQTGLNQVGVSIVRVTPDTKIISVNDAACRSLGYTREELCQKSILEIDATFDPKKWEAHRRDLKAHGTRTFEGTHRRKDGTIFQVEVTVCYLEKEGEEHTISFARDITERKRAEEAVRESELKHRVLIETTATGFVFLDAAGRVLDANDEYLRLAGYDRREQILGRHVTEWTAAHDQARNAGEIRKCIANGSVRGMEVDYVHPDKTVVPIEVNASTLGTGDSLTIVALCRDITGRKRAEAALRESGRRLQTIITGAPIVIYSFDRHGIFTLSEGKGLAGMGLQPGEAVGRSVTDLYRDRPNILENLRRCFAGETFTAQIDIGDHAFEYLSLAAA